MASFFGRLFGWLLIAVAVVMASADAVLALGPGDYEGINAGDLWTLLLGSAPPDSSHLLSLDAVLTAWPAWAVVGLLGLVLLAVSRPRRRRGYRIRRI